MELVPIPVGLIDWNQEVLYTLFQLELHRSAMEMLGEQQESVVTTLKLGGVHMHCDVASAVTGYQYWALVMATSYDDVPVHLLFINLQVPDGPGWVLATQWATLNTVQETAIYDGDDLDETNRLKRGLTSMVLVQIGW